MTTNMTEQTLDITDYIAGADGRLRSDDPLGLQGAADTKVLFKGRYLNLVGGFKVPILGNLGNPNMKYSSLSIDKLSGSNAWATSHGSGRVVELLEPASMGTGAASTWPFLTEGRSQEVFSSVDMIKPEGVFWLDADTILTSGRKHYRSGQAVGWVATIGMTSGIETNYTITDPSDEPTKNMYVMQCIGSGFLRIYDTDMKVNLANGNEFLMGRGGYDVLEGPLGPSIASWTIGDDHADFLMTYSTAYPARRDSYYLYPTDLDNDPGIKLPIWRLPDDDGGFWQSGDVGGSAIINHASVKGVITTANQGRGVLHYSAQGDAGSGNYFLVDDPSVFFNPETGGPNRNDHQSQTEYMGYADGVYGRVIYVCDPADLLRVKNGEIEPHEIIHERYEFPRDSIDIWADNGKNSTKILDVFWDDDRDYLWVAMSTLGSTSTPILAAYELVVDDARPEQSMLLPVGEGFE